MSDSSPEQVATKSNFKILSMTFLTITLFIMAIKVYYREPAQRGAEICYPIYKTYHWVYVDIFTVIFYDDPVSTIKHSRKTHNFYRSCVNRMDRIELLRKF